MICKHCAKACKNSNSLRNHERLCKDNPNKQENVTSPGILAMQKEIDCNYCGNTYRIGNIKRHKEACKENEKNKKICPVCGDTHSKNGVTCSYACSNTHFRSGTNNGNWKDSSYRSTCFLNHKKECVVCGESRIVEVHHYDEDSSNNAPENLIPLCSNHHKYWHSRYKNLVESKVVKYITTWKLQRGLGKK